jgi:hypothetical protein
MAVINGTATWGFVPYDDNASNLAGAFWEYRNNFLKSANDPLRYQVQWFSGSINEGEEPSASGDVINVIFEIYSWVDSSEKEKIATIKKARDIANKRYDTQAVAVGHRFTIDISEIMADQLSYSLCPINKGTWQSNMYGGMNGGLVMQDNVIGNSAATGNPISNYNVSKNGTFRHLEVVVKFEIIGADGQIITATNTFTSETITVINSVNQFERDSLYYNTQFMFDSYGTSSTEPRRFLTRCPNWYYNTTANNVAYNKKVRMDEEAEWLQFYVKDSYNADDLPTIEYYDLIEIYGETFTADGTSQNTFVLVDFTKNLATHSATLFAREQNTMLVQNVSPAFINNNAFVPQNDSLPSIPITAYIPPNGVRISPIDSSTHRYRLYYRGHYYQDSSASWQSKIHSSSNWYEIDREQEKIPYEFVRFHWLNSVGGIDSYTAKRDVVEGLTISRDVIERKSADRTWYQNDTNNGTPLNDSLYHSDTMRGGDIYKGGREVSNLNAERTQSVYTEPLNKDVAKWLEEIMLSPNVWIEMDTDATEMGKKLNPYLRPSDKEYIPVIITNSDVETVNQENGLVKFNIEYTLAHKVITQRN